MSLVGFGRYVVQGLGCVVGGSVCFRCFYLLCLVCNCLGWLELGCG